MQCGVVFGNSKQQTGMRVQLARLPEVRVIVVDYMVIGHCENAKARQTERTQWRQQVRAYLKDQE
eukprot:4538928-Heterocapsa_arctica.AAC.1